MRTWLRAHYGWVLAGLAYVAVFAIGYAAHRPGQRIVTVTEYKDRVVEHTVTVEKPVIQYRDRVITRTVEKPDGTKIETHVTEQSGKETGEKVTHTDRTTDTVLESTTEARPEGRWSVRVLAGANTWGTVSAGGAFDYRFLGPVTAGAWVTVPVAGSPGPVSAGISLGLRLP